MCVYPHCICVCGYTQVCLAICIHTSIRICWSHLKYDENPWLFTITFCLSDICMHRHSCGKFSINLNSSWGHMCKKCQDIQYITAQGYSSEGLLTSWRWKKKLLFHLKELNSIQQRYVSIPQHSRTFLFVLFHCSLTTLHTIAVNCRLLRAMPHHFYVHSRPGAKQSKKLHKFTHFKKTNKSNSTLKMIQ